MNNSEQTNVLFILKSENFKIMGYQKKINDYFIPFCQKSS
jgi:hypothetical protein